jgi:aspartyl-tRNA(Asn)/glutamyl-tRNA(Gln) amidotransferase subunit C
MKLTDKKIDELAHLARLEFKDEEKKAIRTDLDKIIDFCDQLKEVNTEGVEPLVYVNSETNVLREDKVQPMLDKKDALKNAAESDSDYIKVPKVIKK